MPHEGCDTDCELGGAAGARWSHLLVLHVGGPGMGASLGHGKGRALLKQGGNQPCPEKLSGLYFICGCQRERLPSPALSEGAGYHSVGLWGLPKSKHGPGAIQNTANTADVPYAKGIQPPRRIGVDTRTSPLIFRG